MITGGLDLRAETMKLVSRETEVVSLSLHDRHVSISQHGEPNGPVDMLEGRRI